MINSWTVRQDKSNQLHRIIKTFMELFPEEFEKTSIKKCDKCQGGFLNITVGYEVESNLCKTCRGVGFYGFDNIYGQKVCKNCNGVGCRICRNVGYLDWLDAVMRPDKRALEKL